MIPWKRCRRCETFYLYAGACFACGTLDRPVFHFHRVLVEDLPDWVAAGWVDTGTRNPFGVDQEEAVIQWNGDCPAFPVDLDHGPACPAMCCVKKRAAKRAGE